QDERRHFTLSADEIALLNPNTRTCPVFRTKRDAELTKAIYRRVPVLIREDNAKGEADVNPWGIKFMRMIDMANDSGMFRTREELLEDGWKLSGNNFSKGNESYLPLYEAKMLHHFTHRFGDYDDKPEDSQNTSLPDVPLERLQNPAYVVQPRYWVPCGEVIYKITRVPPDLLKAYREGDRDKLRTAVMLWLSLWGYAHETEEDWINLDAKQQESRRERRAKARDFLAEHPLTAAESFELRSGRDDLEPIVARLIEAKAPRWLLGWRDICRSTDERTVIASVLPRVGVGHKFPLMMLSRIRATEVTCLNANLNSFALDFITRQKIGGTSLTYFYLKQFPVLPPSSYIQSCLWSSSLTMREWIAMRVLELIYTAYDLQGFAEDCGYTGDPFEWNQERRFLLRCELDAVYFHLYGINRDDVDYILDTFPIVKRKDEQAHGEYRTKRMILEIYDEMKHAMDTGATYQTKLDPPPANGWTQPELPKEEVNEISIAMSEMSGAKVQSGDLFSWKVEDPQQSFKFDDGD
ncbi:MAG: hypothetical protein J2P31_08045, partial [Blastocatellia bacterium]|nr:hypothetical protein [Blastocatellia bacterium]